MLVIEGEIRYRGLSFGRKKSEVGKERGLKGCVFDKGVPWSLNTRRSDNRERMRENEPSFSNLAIGYRIDFLRQQDVEYEEGVKREELYTKGASIDAAMKGEVAYYANAECD
jgi:hypothetical protein